MKGGSKYMHMATLVHHPLPAEESAAWRLVAAWQSGGVREGAGDQHIRVAVSVDGGTVWKAAGVAVQGDGVPVCVCVCMRDVNEVCVCVCVCIRSPPLTPVFV